MSVRSAPPVDDRGFVTAWVDPHLGWLHRPDFLSPLEREAVAVWLLEVEVGNGGLHQYFSNTRGTWAAAAVDGLQRIGASGTAAMLRRAIAAVGPLPLPEDRGERFDLLDRAAAAAGFAAMEDEFHAGTEDRMALLAAQLRAAPSGAA